MSKVIINLSQGLIEAEGTEDFVKQQVRQFQESMLPIFKEVFDPVSIAQESLSLSESTSVIALDTHDDNRESMNKQLDSQFANMFSINGSGEIYILQTPGSSGRERARNLALIYLFAKSYLKKETTATSDELKDLMKKHACYDSTNFSKIFKKSLFMVTGKGKAQKKYELTVPGTNAAKALLVKAPDVSNT